MKKININIVSKTTYLPEQSMQENHRYLWSYEISIENQSEEIVQLLNRFWRVTELTGKVEEIRGPGVIGLQPIIRPGKLFTYTSFCQLNTPQGTMEGFYEMQTLEEVRFTVQIPKFILSSPAAVSAGFRSKLH